MQRRCGPAQPARTGRGAGPTSYMFILIILPKSCRCPQPDCKAGISADAVRGLLSRREWGAVLDVAAEASLPAEEKIYCPYAECSALLVMGPDFGRAGDSACPHCNKCAFMTWICSEIMCAAGHGTQLWQSRQHREPPLREVRLDAEASLLCGILSCCWSWDRISARPGTPPARTAESAHFFACNTSA